MVIRRASDAPPIDGAAEAALLRLMTMWPDLADSVDLGPLLWCPEHRAVWQAMVRVRVRMRATESDLAEWWIAVRRQLHADVCRSEPIETHYRADDGGWQWRCAGWRFWNVLDDAELPNRYDYGRYVVRLERCAEARRLISAAQEIASRAWRVPVQPFDGVEAAVILERAAPVRRLVTVTSSVNVDDLEV